MTQAVFGLLVQAVSATGGLAVLTGLVLLLVSDEKEVLKLGLWSCAGGFLLLGGVFVLRGVPLAILTALVLASPLLARYVPGLSGSGDKSGDR